VTRVRAFIARHFIADDPHPQYSLLDLLDLGAKA